MILTMIAMAAAAQQCRAYDTHLPRPLSGWTRDGSGLDTRHAVTLPARNGALETRITIRKPGRVGIAIDGDGWIDVYGEHARSPLRMGSESRGPRCSTIRKIVYYRMRAGTYRVTVNRLKGNRAKLMLTHD